MHASRRRFLAALGLGLAAGALPRRSARAAGASMLTRTVPHGGEALPVIGMGTYDTFDVGPEPAGRAPLVEVMQKFIAAGSRVIDSSPMYGRAEGVVGDILGAVGRPQGMFLATKVWTQGQAAGVEQMRRSIRLMGGHIDLMQIHNLLDWRTHLATLREWKAAGTIRYIGITHYQLGAFDDLQRIIEHEKIDFVQLPYSLAVREAEKRLLPAAAANQTAVIVMRPFEKGALFERVKGKSLPTWAADFDCTSWAQLFLKFILGHPAITCVIPATSKPQHVEDDLKAGFGRLPSEEQRKQMIALL